MPTCFSPELWKQRYIQLARFSTLGAENNWRKNNLINSADCKAPRQEYFKPYSRLQTPIKPSNQLADYLFFWL